MRRNQSPLPYCRQPYVPKPGAVNIKHTHWRATFSCPPNACYQLLLFRGHFLPFLHTTSVAPTSLLSLPSHYTHFVTQLNQHSSLYSTSPPSLGHLEKQEKKRDDSQLLVWVHRSIPKVSFEYTLQSELLFRQTSSSIASHLFPLSYLFYPFLPAHDILIESPNVRTCSLISSAGAVIYMSISAFETFFMHSPTFPHSSFSSMPSFPFPFHC